MQHLHVRTFVLFYCLLFGFSSFAQNSVLATGEIYKIETPSTGMYELSYAFLTEKLGINPQDLTKDNVQVLANKGGMLPEIVGRYENNGLFGVPILWKGNNNNILEPNEKLVFYTEGPDILSYSNRYQLDKNIYDVTTYCYIKIGAAATLIQTEAQNPANNNIIDTYDQVSVIEEDRFNLLHDYDFGQGTGKRWFMDKLEVIKEANYSFSIPNSVPNGNFTLYPKIAVRSANNSTVRIRANNENFDIPFGGTNIDDIEATYAFYKEASFSGTNTGSTLDVTVSYPNAGSNRSAAWIDQIMVVADAELRYTGQPLHFSKVVAEEASMQVANASDALEWWDVSSADATHRIEYTATAGRIESALDLTDFRKFIVFDPSTNLAEPKPVGKIANQDIFPTNTIDFLIVYPEEFREEAEALALHRSSYSNMSVKAVSVESIFNEFSSGRRDLIAIRDYAKIVHDINGLQYILLFGDGSFDERQIYAYSTRSNYIPSYQTDNSFSVISGYTSDDIFGLLSDGEGATDRPTGTLDIAIGRLPVRTKAQANDMVEKIKRYDLESDIGNWQNSVTFMADDEDNNVHLNQANTIADRTRDSYPFLNINKLFFDAFEQVTTAGGQKYPAVTEELERTLFQGTLVVNYMGHGGPTSLSQERVLQLEDVVNYSNAQRMPLFVTATCSFTGFDDPSFSSAGEELLLNPRGGAIGLFTTVRAVFSSSNERLTSAVFRELFEVENNQNSPIGEILRQAKNTTSGENSRKFLLVGDPTLRLKLPYNTVQTTAINNETFVEQGDTIKALQLVSLDGEVQTASGERLNNFDGEVTVTVFDKPSIVKTRGQDPSSFVTDFEVQQTIIFQGKASVEAGRFTIEFIVPKDIETSIGIGKISYFATTESNDIASGANTIFIGEQIDNPLIDNEGPNIEMFLNSFQFRDGGTTSENPVLLVQLSDSSGINVSGVRIGHDIKANLSNGKSFILNESFVAEKDNYRKGIVTFPLFDLPEGPQEINLKAWDVANNSSEETLRFVVVNSSEPIVKQLLSYPNPFQDQTTIYIDSNLSPAEAAYDIEVYDASGRLAANENGLVNINLPQGSTVIFPKGGNNKLPSGFYYYQIKLESATDGKSLGNMTGKFIVIE